MNPFRVTEQRKKGCLGNKADQSAAYTLPSSNLVSKCRLEQVANLNDAKTP